MSERTTSERARPTSERRLLLAGWIVIVAGTAAGLAHAQGTAAPKTMPSAEKPAPSAEDADGAETEGVEEDADRILRQMSDYLADLRSFSVTARSSLEVVTKQGERLEFDAASKVQVKRPNLLRSDRLGAYTDMSLFYDGDKLTLLGRRANLYATADAPNKLDDALDFARERLDLEAPGADLLYSDPYSILTEDVVAGRVIGQETLAGVPVQHLAFRGREVDFQIWIEEGPRPVPRKYVITSKKVAGHPEFVVELDDWDLRADLPRSTFEFVPPRGATQIEFRGLREERAAKRPGPRQPASKTPRSTP